MNSCRYSLDDTSDLIDSDNSKYKYIPLTLQLRWVTIVAQTLVVRKATIVAKMSRQDKKILLRRGGF